MRRGFALIELPLVVLLLLALAGVALVAVELARHEAVTPRGWVEAPADLPGGVVDNSRIGRDIRAVERSIPPVAGGDAALRGEEIGAARLLVAPDHGAVQRQSRRRKSRHGDDRRKR